ncbi:MAG: acyl-CoA dehydrogenase [Candidatus Lokiarchaeota archaeon]|nr:acyl-CoA dehydrogenase [Candidatus Lokiarchaeota archaeon]
MDFSLTEEQEMLKKIVREFAERKLKPRVREFEENGIDYDLVRELYDLGVMGLPIPEKYGGGGSDNYLDSIIVMEELARIDPAFCMAANDTWAPAVVINAFGRVSQKKKWIIPMMKGEKFGSFATTEPGAGSDSFSMKTTIKPDGDGFVVNGSKAWITNAKIADIYCVWGYTDKSKRSRGITTAILEKGMDGLSFGKKEELCGFRGSYTGALYFDDVHIPKKNIIGRPGDGFMHLMGLLDSGRIAMAAIANGISQAAFETARDYVKEREQFGRPIANFQWIRMTLADMWTKLQASKLISYKCAYLAEENQMSNELIQLASSAKYYASEVAMWITTNAVQMAGSMGYSKEMMLEKYFRDAKFMSIGEGTTQIQKLILASRLLGSKKVIL